MTDKNNKAPEDGHYVNPAPFDPYSVETISPEQEKFYRASSLQMMWWKFRRHKVAVWSGIILLLLYFSILISEIIAPYGLNSRNADFLYSPPQSINWFPI